MSQTPELAELISLIVNQELDLVGTMVIARVESFNATNQTVSVKPVVKEAHEDEGGNRVTRTIDVIPNVPVHFSGGGGFGATFPLVRGDTGMLIVPQHAIDKWWGLGPADNTTITDPEDDRRFDLNDAVFVPGVRNKAGRLANCPTNGARVGSDSGKGYVVYKTGTVEVGDTPVALATKQDVQDIVDAITNAATGGADGGAAFKAAITAAFGVSGVPNGTTVLKGE